MAMEALRIAAKESKFMKFVLGGFIFLAVGGLVFTDVGGYFTGGGAGGTTVARVGDTKIDVRQFDSELRGVLQQTGMSAEEAYQAGLTNAVLDQKINNILKLQSAEGLNLVLDNKTVAKQINKMFQGASKDQIEMTLRANGLSEQQLAESIQAQTLNRYISAMPLAIANYVPSYIQSANAKIESEQRSGTLYTIPVGKLTDDIQVSDTDIENYYLLNKDLYSVAEERVFSIGKMTLDMAKKDLPKITDEDVRAEYDSRQDDFIVPETRIIEQVVVSNPDDAQAIYEATLNDAPLKQALIDITGTDKGFLTAKGYQQDGLPEDLADSAFDVQINKGDVTAPVKTLLGYTLMAITDIQPEALKSFDDVKKDLKSEMETSAIYDSLYNKIVDTEDLIDRNERFSSIVEKTTLETSKTKSLARENIMNAEGDFKTAIETNPSIIDEIFALPIDGASYPLEISDDAYIVIGISDIKDQSTLPLDDVKADIKKQLLQQRQTQNAEAVLSGLMNDLNNKQASANDLTSKYGARQKPFTDLKRDTESLNKNLIFTTAKGQFAYRLSDENQAIIATISDINFNNKTEPSTDTISMAQRQLIDSLMMAYYRENTKISINQSLLERMYSANSQ